jgi:hypothetical protein
MEQTMRVQIDELMGQVEDFTKIQMSLEDLTKKFEAEKDSLVNSLNQTSASLDDHKKREAVLMNEVSVLESDR